MLASALMSCAARAEDPVPEWLAQSRLLAQQLGTELKAELTGALASAGPTGAIAVCRTRAPDIAARLSRESGAVVSRTALRVRNPANAPDDLQRAILEQFAGELAAGRSGMPFEAAVEIDRGGGIERRYMRAIPMDAMCLACHGQQLAPEVASALASDYPADQATGFEPGQLTRRLQRRLARDPISPESLTAPGELLPPLRLSHLLDLAMSSKVLPQAAGAHARAGARAHPRDRLWHRHEPAVLPGHRAAYRSHRPGPRPRPLLAAPHRGIAHRRGLPPSRRRAPAVRGRAFRHGA